KNAGHTLYLRFDEYDIDPIEGQDGKEINTHQVPSTTVFEHTKNYIGADVWLEPIALDNEINYLNAEGFKIDADKLGVSNLATLSLPHHVREDELKEK